MNRTVLFITAAGALAVLALIAAPRTAQPSPPHARHTPQVPGVPSPTAAPLPKEAQGAAAAAGIQLTGKLASAYLANADAANYLTVEVSADAPEQATPRSPANLVVVIDRSCSMSGQKMRDAVTAARALVDELGPDDRLAVAHYGTDVVAVPSTRADAAGKAHLHEVISRIREDGSTNISGGLEAGAELLRPFQAEYRTNRLVLLSDGQPTAGITSSLGLTQIVSRIREEGVTVTALGVGEDFDERMMRALADAGGGFYGYIDDSARLADVFARELDQASRMVARDVELRLDAPPGVRIEEVLGHNFTRDGNGARLRLYDLSAGLSNRLVVRFSVSGVPGASLAAPIRAQLTWTALGTGERLAAQVAMTGTVTDDPKRALENADADVLAHAANAEAAQQVRYAADLARQGRGAEADRHLLDSLGNIRRIFGSSANALAGNSIEDSRKSLRGGDLNRAAKQMEHKSIQSFGQNNAY